MGTKATSWGRLVRGEYGRFGLRRPDRGPVGPVEAPVVRAGPFVALLVLALLFVAASWVDAGMAAAPDPHPSAKESKRAPDPYQAPAPSEPESSPVTQPTTQVETTPSTGSATRTQAEPKTSSAPGTRTQKTQKEPDKAAATQRTTQTNQRSTPPRLAVATATDGRPLLLGGLAMVALALASGSLLFLVTRSGTGLGRWETKA